MVKNSKKVVLILTAILLFLMLMYVLVLKNTSNSYTHDFPKLEKTIPKDESRSDQNYEEIAEEFDKSKPYFADGFYLVGDEISPGTYRVKSSESYECSFERLNGYGGGEAERFVQNYDQIIANGVSSYPLVVTIFQTDKAFVSKRCGIWTQDLSQITKSTTSFGSGMYIVDVDIESGTYRNSDPSKGISGCQYKRLAGFSGEEKDIILSKATDTIIEVNIEKTDRGFWSEGCGSWKRID